MDTEEFDKYEHDDKNYKTISKQRKTENSTQLCTQMNVPYDNCIKTVCINQLIHNEQKCFYVVNDKFLVRFD